VNKGAANHWRFLECLQSPVIDGSQYYLSGPQQMSHLADDQHFIHEGHLRCTASEIFIHICRCCLHHYSRCGLTWRL